MSQKSSGAGNTSKKKAQKKHRGSSAAGIIAVLAVLLVILAVLAHRLGQLAREPESLPSSSPPPAMTESTEPTLSPSLVSAAAFGEENGFKTYGDGTLTGRLGVDVSSHQGGIDWDKVADAGVEYAIVRVGFRGYGDGILYEDDLAETNCQAVPAAGLELGLYVFSQAVSQEEAIEEANLAIEYANAYGIDRPIYYDWEPVSEENSRSATISALEVTANALAFCRTVEAAGYKAGVYFNLSIGFRYYHLYQLRDYEFWLAEYQDTPSYPYLFHQWQYANDGSVPGIYTNTDLNLSFEAS